ncbi:MAG: sigma-70 family RNA polymerase sigma factor [Candidatus Hydrogenedentes bacterium]|nr:sigma-70 family RNA polymerase sigma factor [Candidatus Hydrogenedentota bacterium]
MTEKLDSLLAACRAGDSDAIARWVARFRPRALAVARGFVADEGLAEDAVQEAFVAALDRLDGLRDADAFPTWFRQVVRTYALRIVRNRRELPGADDFERPSDTPSPREHAHRAELARIVRDAFRALSGPGRETAELFYLEERSCAEVAGILNVPEGTVKRRLHDVRGRLRGMLLGSLGEDTPTPDAGKEPRLPL